MKKTMIAASLLLLLVPLTALTTIHATTPPGFVRIQDGCVFMDAALVTPTITEGTSSVEVRGQDTCDPPPIEVTVSIWPEGSCYVGDVFAGPVHTYTDASSKFSVSVPTSTLLQGSYCVEVVTGYGAHQELTLTVTGGTPPPGACFTAETDRSTITQGQSPVMLHAVDNCDPPGTLIGMVVQAGPCPPLPTALVELSPLAVPTDAMHHMTSAVDTSSLGVGSHCIVTWPAGYGSSLDVHIDLTVTPGTPPPPSGTCFDVSLYPSTITEGTSSIVVRGSDTCDPAGAQISVSIHPSGDCGGAPLFAPVFAVTDASYKFQVNIPTSTLGAGSYCVHTQTTVGTIHSADLALTVTTGTPPPAGGFDFTLAFSPSTLSVTAGGVANFPILVTFSDPSYSTTTITVAGVSGLGAGMNYQIIPSPPTLSVSTSPSTPTGTYTITLTGSAMGVTRHASAVLAVQGAQQGFDFSIGVSPLDQIVNTGGSTTCTVTVNLVSGATQSVALSVPDAPSGVTVTFSAPSGSPTFTSTLTISASQSASPGKYAITLTGIGGGKTHTLPVALIIQASPDFRVEVDPPSQSVPQGQNAKYVVHVAGSNGFNSQVSLTVDGLPAGVNGVFDVPSSSPDFTTTLTLTIPSNSPTGSFTLTITGSGGGTSRVANAALTINPTTQTQSPTQTQSQTQTQATTQTGGAGSANDLLGMIQQNSLLVIGILAIVIVLFGFLALRGRKPSSAPSPPAQPQVSPFTCSACGTQNPVGNDFCANCGRRLQ